MRRVLSDAHADRGGEVMSDDIAAIIDGLLDILSTGGDLGRDRAECRVEGLRAGLGRLVRAAARRGVGAGPDQQGGEGRGGRPQLYEVLVGGPRARGTT